MDRTAPIATSLVTVLTLALSACGADGSPSVSTPTSRTATVTPDAIPETPSTVPEITAKASGGTTGVSAVSRTRVAAAPPARSAAPGETLLILEPDGVGLLQGTSVRHLTFGAPMGTVSTALSATLDPLSRSSQAACGQGARIQLSGQGFSALFDGAQFVGWVDTGRTKKKLTTMNGVGVGTTLATLQSRSPSVEVTEGSLGPEWTMPAGESDLPSLGGLLDGTAPTSEITAIYAGETCFFR